MPTSIDDLDTPAVLIDIDRVEQNLKRAQAHANAEGYKLRPHIKTHKLPKFALRQIELGAVGITAQKLGEAEVMADAGIRDIFITYNIIGAKKLERLKNLNERVTLSVVADSLATIEGYAATFDRSRPLTVLVECDTGGGRCGAQDPLHAAGLATQIRLTPGLRFGGLMTYPKPHDVDASIAWLAEAVTFTRDMDVAVPRVTTGNTPDMWAPLKGPVTERRPGVYIYNDRSQIQMGAAEPDHCALTVLATVVSRPTGTRVVIDAGSKALSSDLLGLEGYGMLVDYGHIVTSISEEHGVIEMDEPSELPRVGDRVRVLPNHACVVSNLFDEVNLISGDTVTETLRVAARGRLA